VTEPNRVRRQRLQPVCPRRYRRRPTGRKRQRRPRTCRPSPPSRAGPRLSRLGRVVRRAAWHFCGHRSRRSAHRLDAAPGGAGAHPVVAGHFYGPHARQRHRREDAPARPPSRRLGTCPSRVLFCYPAPRPECRPRTRPLRAGIPRRCSRTRAPGRHSIPMSVQSDSCIPRAGTGSHCGHAHPRAASPPTGPSTRVSRCNIGEDE
jgi:hypothetical protein